jgi:Uma2 family endonuclease
VTDQARPLKMTADDFLAFEGEGDTRYELIDGEIVAMAPPSDPHGTIVVNAAVEIDRRLEAHPTCRLVLEAGIRLDEHSHYKADVAATCAEQEGAAYVHDPFLIVEVLSPTTATDDLGVKLPRYITMPSVREVWLVDSRERWVQVWRRVEESWVVTLPPRGSATFRSAALDDGVALDRLYRKTRL